MKAVKITLEILLMIVILGMIYKLATNNTIQNKMQDKAIEQALESGNISALPLKAGMGDTSETMPDMLMPQYDAQRIADEIIQQTLSPSQHNNV